MKKLISSGLFLILALTSFTTNVTAHEEYNTSANIRYNTYQLENNQNPYYTRTTSTASRATQQRARAKRTTGQPQIIYIYQNVPADAYGHTYYTPGYPGCGRSDIILGGQSWAACILVSRSA